MPKTPKIYLLILLAAFATGILAGCNGKTGDANASDFPMASTDGMPAEIQAAPPVVLESYQFAAANPEILSKLPCYCGCGNMGHTSNYACYVKTVSADGVIAYDDHALGCSICVDITQDAMRMLKEDKPLSEIRVFVDETYSQYGPSNMPPGE